MMIGLEEAIARYVDTFQAIDGNPMSRFRMVGVVVLLKSKSVQEILTFCDRANAAVASGHESHDIARLFMKFENGSITSQGVPS